MKKLCILVFMFLCALQINSMAQGGTAIDKQLEQLRTRQTYNMHKEHWNAAWIEVPDADRNAFGVFYFRKDIEISSLPDSCLCRPEIQAICQWSSCIFGSCTQRFETLEL